MVLGDYKERGFDIADQHLPVLNLDPELALNGVVDVHTGPNITAPVGVSEVGVEGYGHVFPAEGVDFP